jgi:hypothetical protein
VRRRPPWYVFYRDLWLMLGVLLAPTILLFLYEMLQLLLSKML